MKTKKKGKRSLFDDRRVTIIASVLLAVISWIIVAGFIDPGETKTIEYVPIDYARDAETYAAKGLQIVGDYSADAYADVQVTGDGAETGGLGTGDVTAYPDYSRVTTPGVHEIPLRAAKVTGGDYSITGVSLRNSTYSLKTNPKATVTLTFEEVATKKLTVEVDSSNITAASGFFKDEPIATPSEVTITGPKTEVDRIIKAVAIVEDEEELSTRKIFTGVPLTLLDANGHEIDQETLSVALSTQTVEVDIPILEIGTLNLGVSFYGQTPGFDMDWLMSRIHLSMDQLQVVGESSAFNNVDDPYNIANFDISELAIGWESDPIDIELPSALRSLDPMKQVTVTFDSTDLISKTFEINANNITVVNAPVNASISPVANSVSVELIGPADQIDALLPEDIVVQIDAFSITGSKSGQQTLPVRILIPGSDRVFASGSYSMVCNISPK